jgi:hypothetical protein
MISPALPHILPSHTAIGVCAAGLILCVFGSSLRAQTPPATAQSSPVPSEPVLLSLRGKPGDTFTYTFFEHDDSDIKAGLGSFQIYNSERKQLSWTLRLRGFGPDKALLMEVHRASGQNIKENNGEYKTLPLAPAAALFTLSPDAHLLHIAALSAAPSSSTHQGIHQSSKAAAAAARNSTIRSMSGAIEVFTPIPFPDKPVHVGDTWTGTYPINRFNPFAKNTEPPSYTATLVAVETHRGVPCAKVEYKIEYNGDVPGVTESILQKMPAGSTLDGTAKLASSETVFYTLDRGAVMDLDTTIQVTLDYQAGIPDPNTGVVHKVDLEGTITDSEKQSATKFPPPDSSLISTTARTSYGDSTGSVVAGSGVGVGTSSPRQKRSTRGHLLAREAGGRYCTNSGP